MAPVGREGLVCSMGSEDRLRPPGIGRAEAIPTAPAAQRAEHVGDAVEQRLRQFAGIALAVSFGVSLTSAQTGAIVVEDDYDSEFRFSGRPIPALAAAPGAPSSRRTTSAASA